MNRSTPPPAVAPEKHVIDELLDLRATVVRLEGEIGEVRTNVSKGLRSIHKKLDVLIKRGSQ